MYRVIAVVIQIHTSFMFMIKSRNINVVSGVNWQVAGFTTVTSPPAFWTAHMKPQHHHVGFLETDVTIFEQIAPTDCLRASRFCCASYFIVHMLLHASWASTTSAGILMWSSGGSTRSSSPSQSLETCSCLLCCQFDSFGDAGLAVRHSFYFRNLVKLLN